MSIALLNDKETQKMKETNLRCLLKINEKYHVTLPARIFWSALAMDAMIKVGNEMASPNSNPWLAKLLYDGRLPC